MDNKSKVNPNKGAPKRKILGFMFYPQDWWTSDSFYEFNQEERYTYLECLFYMYLNNGYLPLSREQFARRLRTQIKPKTWEKITQMLTCTNLGYTHPSVKKRRTRAETSRENGKLGGRPRKPENPAINLPFKYNIKERKKTQKETVSDGKEKVSFGYTHTEFLKDWNSLRTEHLKKPSYLNRMGNDDDKRNFEDLKTDYSKEDIQNALIGLFKQKHLPNGNTTMQSNPAHFLKYFNSYLTAYHDKNQELYGEERST
jgi:hypothetical protein